jgi:xanthine dehydrogenase YagT iron-sulfur-binding subunit
LVEGSRANSCLTLSMMHDERSTTTSEGLAASDNVHPLQAAF